jgi:4-hydroxyphenylpyruvate dioxygenase
MDPLSWSRHHRLFPGQGELDVARFLRELLGTGWAGMLSLEIFNDEFRAAPARANAADAMRSLLWLEEQVRALPSLHPPHPSHGASHRVPLLDPPPPPVLHGWSFLEFAVDAPTAERLSAYIAALGFSRIGRHRSKHVELWGQGEVRIVLNLEDDSFARSYFELHGTSACAVALATDDAAAALARAEALGCTRVAGRVGANELTIPAVRAPDGSLVYFFDVHRGGSHGFEADFVIEHPVPADAAFGGEGRIDHVAQVIPAGHVERWVLFYRAVLGLAPRGQTILHDPYGVIRSRPLESANGALRYALNVSERDSTAVARSVGQFGGAGVHHIAVAVTDAEQAVRHLRARGALLLPIPANYYDDLEARYGLEPALLAHWRTAGLMYERDAAGGEFLHAYTVPFDSRFYFEIIERRGGYAGYGALDAPVRLAALAQWQQAHPPEARR